MTDVTAGTQAERRIWQSETELRQVLDLTPIHITEFAPDGTRLYNNRAALEYHGMTLEEWQGAGLQRLIHPQDAERLKAEQPANFSRGVPFELEARLRRHDGQYRWFLARFNPKLDEQGRPTRWYAAATDIEDRKQAEDALHKSEERWRSVFENSAIGVALTDLRGRFLATNAVYQNMLGYTAEEFDSLTFLDLTHENYRQSNWQLTTELLEGKRTQFQIEKQYRRKDGHPIWVSNNASIVPGTGGMPPFLMCLSEDITDRKHTEEMLRQSQADVQGAFEEIRRLKDRLQEENLALREEVVQASMFEEIVGSSPALQVTLTSVSMVAPTDSTVLVAGETGTGKELIARAIHKRSRRTERAFVSVNCAAIPPALIASELFGHEKGAFTGAVQQRRGRFELAHQGTIFLDEIGEVPMETQLALLRVLQERQFERVGGGDAIPVDVRIIAATNRDLSVAVAAGTFRSDLFYRLNVFPIDVPPLRDRKEDIPLLLEYFVKRFADKMGKHIHGIDKRTVELCQAYGWPGNIRELQNIVERSVILCTGDTFGIDEAWLSGRGPTANKSDGLPDTLSTQEKTLIEAALARSRGKVAGANGAAVKLGIPASTLESKIRQLKIEKQKFTGASS
jgi:formate hydrogenlyase transcriptional activator